MTAGLSGPDLALVPGDEREFPDAEAQRLIDAGYAVPVVGKKPEKATKRASPERRG